MMEQRTIWYCHLCEKKYDERSLLGIHLVWFHNYRKRAYQKMKIRGGFGK